MTDKIIEILKASSADAWEVIDTVTEAWEFYFIKHELDQNRVRDVEHITVKVHRKLEDGKFLGTASEEIPPTATEEEVKKVIDNLYERASFVKNPYYELNSEKVEVSSTDVDPRAVSKAYIEALNEVPETSGEFINSYEIFVEKNKRRYVNSEGIDATVVSPSSMVEVVVNARNEEHEIEIYSMYKAGTCDKEHIVSEIKNSLKYGKDRLSTVPTPVLNKATVVLPTEDAGQIYKWFACKMMAEYKYRGYSNFEIGKEISDKVKGDKITLLGLKELPNSSSNGDIDSEGAKTKDMYIIRDNVPENFWGGCQCRYYLGIKDSYVVSNFQAIGGSKTEAELRSGTYLEVVQFSDFTVDEITGEIAGEIRLGYYHEGDKVTPVSGGSVSGSLAELMNCLYMSKESKQYNNMLMPSIIKIEDMTIAGAE